MATAPPEASYLSPKEVAALLHVSSATVSRWARAAQIPHVRTLGGHRRYPSEAVRRLAEELSLPVVPSLPLRSLPDGHSFRPTPD